MEGGQVQLARAQWGHPERQTPELWAFCQPCQERNKREAASGPSPALEEDPGPVCVRAEGSPLDQRRGAPGAPPAGTLVLLARHPLGLHVFRLGDLGALAPGAPSSGL